jgi:hypothetical protein
MKRPNIEEIEDRLHSAPNMWFESADPEEIKDLIFWNHAKKDVLELLDYVALLEKKVKAQESLGDPKEVMNLQSQVKTFQGASRYANETLTKIQKILEDYYD